MSSEPRSPLCFTERTEVIWKCLFLRLGDERRQGRLQQELYTPTGNGTGGWVLKIFDGTTALQGGTLFALHCKCVNESGTMCELPRDCIRASVQLTTLC